MQYTSDLAVIFEKNIQQLKNEIILVKDEKSLWETMPGVTNSIGNLCLHLTGNLNHFIGAGLGNTNYVRNRDAEFSSKNIDRKILLSQLDDAAEMIKAVLPELNDDDMKKDSPKSTPDRMMTTGYLLLHLLAHFNYHLGQINYLRRISEHKQDN